MIVERMAELGYQYQPAKLKTLTFHSATRVGNLVFTSGQVSKLDDLEIRGKVGQDVDLRTAQKAAEICAFNCFRAAGAVVNVESITRVVKMLGMVNVGAGFNLTSEVIHGASELVNRVLGENGYHARSAIGVVLPSNWAVEIEMVMAVE